MEYEKIFPKLASEGYLTFQFMTRGKSQNEYIKYFMSSDPIPHPNVVNLETINRCNSTCEFCTANKNAEKRPYARMEESLYYNIIDQLRDWGYKGHLTCTEIMNLGWIQELWNSTSMPGNSCRKRLFSCPPTDCSWMWTR